jgi:Terminase RNaseH-like domain
MVEATIRMIDPNVSYSAVRASRGKVIRAEPVAALYEQGRIHHVGAFPMLEDQQCAFSADFDRAASGYSPDRVDALVWAFSDLLVEQMTSEGHYLWAKAKAESLRPKPLPPPKPVYAPGSVEFEMQQREQENR